jgi:E3 ubiquitin-protein ligase TRIP12
MDLESNNHQDLTSAGSSQSSHQDTVSTPSVPRPLRFSARVRAAKEKTLGQSQETDTEYNAPRISSPTTNSTSALSTRSKVKPTAQADENEERNLSKRKATEQPKERPSKRPRRAIDLSLTIDEPKRDDKGKQREVEGQDEHSDPESSQSKKLHYSLRSQSTSTHSMPKSSKSPGKGKTTHKGNSSVASTSKLLEHSDAEMTGPHDLGVDLYAGNPPEDECMACNDEAPDNGHTESGEEGPVENDIDQERDVEDYDDRDDEEEEEMNLDHDDDHASSAPGAMDEPSLFAMFGDYRQLGSFMMSLSTRLKSMLDNIKPTADPTTRLITLQELSELLSISTEDTLAGSFPIEQFVRELVRILGGKGTEGESGEEDTDTGSNEQSEDAALAAAIAMSGGTAYQGDENPEAQVLACRCLANLMEALPGVAHTVVYHGAIPALCSKLLEISYIDLAEQTLSTLEKISEEFPSSIVREGGLAALLGYLDFFSIAVQRTALQAAANCCRNVSSEHFPMIQSVWPIIRNCLSYSDQRIVEYACICVIRVVDAYHRSSTDFLEKLMDIELIRSINVLLLPSGGSSLIATSTYTLLIRALAISTRASSAVMLTLLKADIVDTLYQILTGVLPPCNISTEQGEADSNHGLGGGIADMAVMDNLAHRPKDQVEETLSLTSELMPPLPKDGIFDHKNYTEKALARMVKAKVKADRAASRQATVAAQSEEPGSQPSADASETLPVPVQPSLPTQVTGSSEAADSQSQSIEESGTQPAPAALKDPTKDRISLIRSELTVASRFMQLMVPILVDVYSASVSTSLRAKALTGILKAASFLDEEDLKTVLKCVPTASFISSVLSSRDHPSLVINALQLVDILLSKIPALFKPAFKREGVFHEVHELSARETNVARKHKDKTQLIPSDASATTSVPSTQLPSLKKLTSLSMEPDDAVTLRARVIKFKYLSDPNEEESDNVSDPLRQIVETLSSPTSSSLELLSSLRQLAQLFASPRTSISSFELLQSGLVDSLLKFSTDDCFGLTSLQRKDIFLEAFASCGADTKVIRDEASPMATFVKKLQESLTRMEPFEVTTVSQSTDDSKRSSPSLLARQLRLRLNADEDSDIPRSLHSLVVSIHAIATFQALHDYLRPRVSGLFLEGPRISSMLAALAASGLSGAGTSHLSAPPFGGLRPDTNVDNKEAGEAESSNSISAPVSRRRSKRLSNLSAKPPGTMAKPDSSSTASISSALAHRDSAEPAATAPQDDLHQPIESTEYSADFTDDDMDADIFDHVGEAPESETTVSVSVNEDGSKVVAQTPQGTRIATPSATVPTTAKPGSPPRGSYASALKSKPTDWHLEFSMDDHPLPLDLTIYGAVHQSEMRKKSSLPSSLLWQGIYTVKFKKVPGPAPSSEARESTESSFKSRSHHPVISSLPTDAPHTKILNLLRFLYRMNSLEREGNTGPIKQETLADAAFMNNKLTAKLTRQLEEPMIVASSCLPDWALDLPQHFPFLFPFATRYNFLQSTSFGYARLILKWQSQQTRGQDHSRREEGIGFLGRLQRQKVRISRSHLLESAVKVFELYGSSSSVLEVEYFEEVGTGLGPTLEFYSLVSKEFVRRDLKIWRDVDPSHPGAYAFHPRGLYPAPVPALDIASDGGRKRTHLLRVIGQFVAKAMLDSRIVDLSFNPVFLKHVLGEEVPLTIATLKHVDPDLASSLIKLESLSAQHLDGEIPEGGKIEDLAIDFTLPGYDIELIADGTEKLLTPETTADYIQRVLNATIGDGVKLQADAFREGFSKVFPVDDLQAFTAEELVMLFGDAEEDWSLDTLSESVKADHGFTTESRAIRHLVEIMTEYDSKGRRDLLQFITGSPKLPIGGFRGLNPPLTVVKKLHEPPLTADDYLPSVMTCVNYLKLPEYSSKEIMREKIRVAMEEGVGSFHLS